MRPITIRSGFLLAGMAAFTALLALCTLSCSQATISSAGEAPPSSPPSPVSGIRNKISAGDLLSAESILEVHHEKNGEDGPWLVGLSWLGRGALLLGDTAKATDYSARTRTLCADRISKGAKPEDDAELEIALGASIEVRAQLLQRTGNQEQAAEYLRSELAGLDAPASLISRLNKRLNIMTLTGQPAPELAIEDYLGNPPPTLASLRGKPVLIFVWAQWCGDCKAQAASLARVKKDYEDRGLQVISLTRYYEDEAERGRERFLIDSVWTAVYSDVGMVPMVISTESMQRYGGSSTPTFVFVDRAGVVQRYTPTRLTDEELGRTLEDLMK